MSSTHRSDQANVAELLSEGAWVRALARRLVADDADADDVVQDTWVAAMSKAPHERERLRPWLARVVRNFALASRRSGAHRAAREAESAQRELEPAAAETAERLEAQRALVEALTSLAEPYRTTLMRRYFDGLSAADIAREDGLPAATVRWRIAHGIEELRGRLDRHYGDRASWSVAFLPLVRMPSSTELATAGASGGVTLLGVLTMSTAARAAIAAIVLLSASIGVWFVVHDSERTAAPSVHAQDEVALAAPPRETSSTPELANLNPAQMREVASPLPAPATTAPKEAPNAHARLEGRFVDASGRPIARVHVSQPPAADEKPIASDEQGRFALDLAAQPEATSLPFQASCSGWATIFTQVNITAGATTAMGSIVLEPGGAIAGFVVDENGAPVSGAHVLSTKPDFEEDIVDVRRNGPKSLRYVERGTSPGLPYTFSAADGSFLLEGSAARVVRAWAWLEGMRWGVSEPIDVPAHGMISNVELKLVPLSADDRIEGVVLDPDGHPLPEAFVNYECFAPDGINSSQVSSNDAGRFRIIVPRRFPHRVTASAPRNRWPNVQLQDVQPGTLDVVLQFHEARHLDVYVHDAQGRPIEQFAYSISANDGGAHAWHDRDEAHSGGHLDIEMPEVSFTVEVWARGRARVKLGPIDPAATSAQRDCRLDPLTGIRGQVLAGDRPVAGAKVQLHELVAEPSRFEQNGFLSRITANLLDTATTDSDGRFQLTPRTSKTCAILCEAPGYALAELSPILADPQSGRDDVTIQVGLGGSIEGRVLMPAGRDVAGIIVGITRFDLAPRTQRVGADGRFRFEQLTPGGWSVRRVSRELDSRTTSSSFGFNRDTPVRYDTDCVVEEGRVTAFDVDLRETFDTSLAGRVSVNGAPAMGWTIQMWAGDQPVAPNDAPTGTVDANGDVRIALLGPGRHRLRLCPIAEQGTTLRLERSIEIAAGRNPWTADLLCGAVEGRVADFQNGWLLNCTVLDDGELSCEGQLHCDEQGRFHVPYLPAGRVRLTLRDTNSKDGWKARLEKEIEVKRGETATVELP